MIELRSGKKQKGIEKYMLNQGMKFDERRFSLQILKIQTTLGELSSSTSSPLSLSLVQYHLMNIHHVLNYGFM